MKKLLFILLLIPGLVNATRNVVPRSPDTGNIGLSTDPWHAVYGTKFYGDGSSLTGMILTETDPVFVASPANSITNILIGNWNTAFSWGNHAAAGYVSTSGSYPNPSWITSILGSIVSGNISGKASTITGVITSTQISAGLLPSNVIVSSVAVGSIQDNAIVAILGSKVSGSIPGNAGTATALAANGTNCSATQAAIGVDASGNAEGCWTPAGTTYSADEASLHMTGTVFSAIPSSVTLQGNTFNLANKLVKLDGSGALPAISGANLTGVITSESDPIFVASVAHGIGSTDVSNWNTAFGWGNHAVAGYSLLNGTQTFTGTDTFTHTVTGSISGNSGTVTNGVYTSGSYSDPSWLTLSEAKITNLTTDLHNIGVSTGSIQTSLTSEIANRTNADTAIGVTTGSLRTDLTAETNARIAANSAISVDTGTLRTDVNAKLPLAGGTMTGTIVGTTMTTSGYFDSIGGYYFSGSLMMGAVSSKHTTLLGVGTGVSGDYTTYVGYQSGNTNTGNYNIYLGALSGGNIPSGANNNTYLGYHSGYSAGGHDNIIIGYTAGSGLSGGTNASNIIIGAAGVSGSNQLNIGDLIVGTIGSSTVTVKGNLTATHYYGDGSTLSGIAITETDPIFVASVAHGIVSGDITNWNGKVDRAGDTMTGNLVIHSSITANIATIGYQETIGAGYGVEPNGIKINGSAILGALYTTNIGDMYNDELILHRHSATTPSRIILARSNSANNSHGAITNGLSIADLIGAGSTDNTPTNYQKFGAISIQASASGSINSGSAPGTLSFLTTPNGSITPSEKMKIDSDGTTTITGDLHATNLYGNGANVTGVIHSTITYLGDETTIHSNGTTFSLINPLLGLAWINDDFTSITNASTTTFTLTHTPSSNSVIVIQNGIVKTITTDYTIVGSNLIMNTAPIAGTHLIARYTNPDASASLLATNNSWTGSDDFVTLKVSGVQITTTSMNNWNTAYSWGNPSGVYLPLAGGTMTGSVSYKQMIPINQTPFSGTSATPDSNYSMFVATATGGTLTINAPTGSPLNGQKLLLSIQDDGTSRNLTFDSIYRVGEIALPLFTTQNKRVYLGFMYNSSVNKWDLLGVTNGF